MDPKPGDINYVDQTPPAQKPRTYWMVHGGESGKPSSVIHFSFESAETEAVCLAEVNAGCPFFVMRASTVLQVSCPQATKTVL